MENYKFKIREFKEKTIEIEGKNSDEVIRKLAGYFALDDEDFCKEVTETGEGVNVILNEIHTDTSHTFIDDEDEINEDCLKFLLSNNEKNMKLFEEIFGEGFLEDDEETEDDLPEEY